MSVVTEDIIINELSKLRKNIQHNNLGINELISLRDENFARTENQRGSITYESDLEDLNRISHYSLQLYDNEDLEAACVFAKVTLPDNCRFIPKSCLTSQFAQRSNGNTKGVTFIKKNSKYWMLYFVPGSTVGSNKINVLFFLYVLKYIIEIDSEQGTNDVNNNLIISIPFFKLSNGHFSEFSNNLGLRCARKICRDGNSTSIIDYLRLIEYYNFQKIFDKAKNEISGLISPTFSSTVRNALTSTAGRIGSAVMNYVRGSNDVQSTIPNRYNALTDRSDSIEERMRNQRVDINEDSPFFLQLVNIITQHVRNNPQLNQNLKSIATIRNKTTANKVGEMSTILKNYYLENPAESKNLLENIDRILYKDGMKISWIKLLDTVAYRFINKLCRNNTDNILTYNEDNICTKAKNVLDPGPLPGIIKYLNRDLIGFQRKHGKRIIKVNATETNDELLIKNYEDGVKRETVTAWRHEFAFQFPRVLSNNTYVFDATKYRLFYFKYAAKNSDQEIYKEVFIAQPDYNKSNVRDTLFVIALMVHLFNECQKDKSVKFIYVPMPTSLDNPVLENLNSFLVNSQTYEEAIRINFSNTQYVKLKRNRQNKSFFSLYEDDFLPNLEELQFLDLNNDYLGIDRNYPPFGQYCGSDKFYKKRGYGPMGKKFTAPENKNKFCKNQKNWQYYILSNTAP